MIKNKKNKKVSKQKNIILRPTAEYGLDKFFIRITDISPAYCPKHWGKKALKLTKENILRSERIAPLIVNIGPEGERLIVRGNLSYYAAKELDCEVMPVTLLGIEDRELALALSRKFEFNQGGWTQDLITALAKEFLCCLGAFSEENKPAKESSHRCSEAELAKNVDHHVGD